MNQKIAEHNFLCWSVDEHPAVLEERLRPPTGLRKEAGGRRSCQERESIVWVLMYHRRLIFSGFFGNDSILIYFLPLNLQWSPTFLGPGTGYM